MSTQRRYNITAHVRYVVLMIEARARSSDILVRLPDELLR